MSPALRVAAAVVLALLVDGRRAVAAPAAAERDAGERIGVLEIDASGVSAAAGQKFEQGVIDGLAGAGVQVMDAASVARALANSDRYVDGCSFGPCLAGVRAATGVRRLLVARIEGVGRTYSFVVSLIDSETGRITSQVAQRCPVCTVEDAITTATLATIELVSGVAPAAAASSPAALESARLHARLGRVRHLGWIELGVGVALAALGGVVAGSGHRDGWAGGAVGAGVALATGGGLLVVLAGRYDR